MIRPQARQAKTRLNYVRRFGGAALVLGCVCSAPPAQANKLFKWWNERAHRSQLRGRIEGLITDPKWSLGAAIKAYPDKDVADKLAALAQRMADSAVAETSIGALQQVHETLVKLWEAVSTLSNAREALAKNPSRSPDDPGLARLITLVKQQEQRLLGDPPTADDLRSVTHYAAHATDLAGLDLPVLDAFFDLGRLEILVDHADIANRDAIVGGTHAFDVTGGGKGKAMTLRLAETDQGSAWAIRITTPLAPGDLGKWHSHPDRTIEGQALTGLPVPDRADLAPFNTLDFEAPHVIVAGKEARLFLHQVLLDLASPTLRQRAVPYGTAERAAELQAHGYKDSDPECTGVSMPPDYQYLSFPAQ